MTPLQIAVEAVEAHGAMQKPVELAGLLALVEQQQPLVVYEVGTATGGTLWALAQVTDATLVSIDVGAGAFSGGATISPEGLRSLIPGNELIVIRGDSRTVELPDLAPDLVVIDGDHSLEGVRADWERYRPLTLEGGLVVFHDVLPHPPETGVEVHTLWAELIETEANTMEIVDRSHGSGWGGIGVVFA